MVVCACWDSHTCADFFFWEALLGIAEAAPAKQARPAETGLVLFLSSVIYMAMLHHVACSVQRMFVWLACYLSLVPTERLLLQQPLFEDSFRSCCLHSELGALCTASIPSPHCFRWYCTDLCMDSQAGLSWSVTSWSLVGWSAVAQQL